MLWPSVATPAAEVDAIKDLTAHLSGLAYSVLAWEAALILLKTAIDPPPSISLSVASRWRFIACNECVHELYHLRSRLEKIRTVRLRYCPSLRPYLDNAKLRGAAKKIDEYFPDIEALRHAIAHQGDNEAHPEKHAPDGRYALSGLLAPGRFSAAYEGQTRYLDITDRSLQQIIEVVQEFFDAFASAATELENQGHLE